MSRKPECTARAQTLEIKTLSAQPPDVNKDGETDGASYEAYNIVTVASGLTWRNTI